MELTQSERFWKYFDVILPIVGIIVLSCIFNMYFQILGDSEANEICYKSEVGLSIQ